MLVNMTGLCRLSVLYVTFLCVCVCVCACVRACVRACVCVCACACVCATVQVQIPALLKAGFVRTQDATFPDLQSLVSNLNSWLLYYSIAGVSLYSWLLSPDGRVQKFHTARLQQETQRVSLITS